METVKFEELGLYPQLLRAIKEMGFEEATPIQSQAIPVVMSGVDVIGQAQTGTGKTASFGIPLLMKVDPNNKKTQAIVLSPTRELAIQSAEEIRKLAKYMHGIKVLPIYGGQDISRQIKALKGGATIIIGTPGRVMDHLRLDLCLAIALDLFEFVYFLALNEIKRFSGTAGASGSSDPVHIIFIVLRQIIVEYRFNIIHINSTRCNIGCNQNICFSIPEIFHHTVTLHLFHIAVNPLSCIAAPL